ncbi:MAG: YopX family protein [Ruminococcus bicirculans (ex Wegman et al. 2014)]
MREILFRGKRTDNGEWVSGYYVCKKRPYFKNEGVNLEHLICRNLEIENGDCKQFVDTIMTTYVVNPETIGQYTGVTDVNGNKIFEGDIVWNSYNEDYGKVEWDNDTARFIITCSTFTVNFNSVWGEKLEIDGNVYDNPELLKAGVAP